MRRVLLTIGAAVFCIADLDASERTPVTITGCVNDGTTRDTFVLTNVQEITNGESHPVTMLYWLSSTKGLRDYVNKKVEVRGTYSLDRDAGKTGKVKVETDKATGDSKVVLENGAKKAEAKIALQPVGTSGVVMEQTKPYRRLEVDTVKLVAAQCDPLQ